MRVTVLDRGAWPLHRQLDEAAGALLRQLMADLGVEIIAGAQASRLNGNGWLHEVALTDGRTLPADLCLVAAGIQPRAELAREAGLEVRRGVVVDAHMQTSDPAIYAAGDVAECEGRVVGLWPAGVAQARVAAANLLGGDMHYEATNPPVKLKVAGIDLLSVGQSSASMEGEREVHASSEGSRRYRKLVLHDDRLVGAILIGYPDLADAVTTAVEARREVSHLLPALERGDWAVLGA